MKCITSGQSSEIGHVRVPYLILEGVESLEDELKEGVQVVWARGGHEDIGVAAEVS